MSSLSKESMNSGCNHNRLDFALFASGTGIHTVSWAFCHRKWFSGQRWLKRSKVKMEFKPEKVGFDEEIVRESTWSIFKGSPSSKRASAGTISPSLMLIISPGTNIAASSSFHRPSRRIFINYDTKSRFKNEIMLFEGCNYGGRIIWWYATLAFGARRAMRAAAALPALFSSMKLMVELIISKVMIPTKSCQSGGFPCEFWNELGF